MVRPAQPPRYRKHTSGNARVTINGRDWLLGPWGTQVSKREYDRVVADYLASGRCPSFGVEAEAVTMAMVMADYLKYAKGYFGPESHEYSNIRCAVVLVRRLYTDHPAAEFDTLRLIPSLKRGRTTAREPEPVKPVHVAVVEATLPKLPPIVANMVRLQLLCGCRPGEICKLSKLDQRVTLLRSVPNQISIWFSQEQCRGVKRN